jgi:CHAT domain-containing protein
MTAQLNAAALYGMTVGGTTADADACAHLLQQVADEAADRSAEHEATAWSNLAGLRLGQGRWDDATACFGRARAARSAMIKGSAGRHTQLGEVIATGDLAVREALVHTHQRRLDTAVETLEDGRVTLLRHRRAVPDGPAPIPDDPGRAVVYLGSCDVGTFGIVRSQGQPDRGFVSAFSARSLRSGLRALVTAPTRMERILAVRRVEDMLGDLAGVVAILAGNETRDLCVVACGPLAGAPLHTVPDSTGRSWLDRWPVRYWPSAQVAATLRRPRPVADLTAVAVAGEEHDLPLASSELAAVGRSAATVEIPPPEWKVEAWLRGTLRRAGIAHFACHARSDLVDPTGSSFDFGAGGRLTVADLLDWDDVEGLEMVVASACQAGVPASEAPDEFLGIGFGLLHTGAQSVISPLWEVNDTPAALLVARLYHELADGREPADALRLAQLWVRDVDNAALVSLATAASVDNLHHAADWLPKGLAVRLTALLGDADPADRPFRHPVDWAAFTYLGA